MGSKMYFKKLDLLRVLSCIAVLLYHLNILKGGYLAVCVFFVLSGYLSCVSAFRKEKFSFKDYYINRLKHIYLPLLIIVFITIGIISFIPIIKWLNLKPETTSVLLGYNNFWQLNANLDYFARHINSPFIHLWYIGILLQFELVFPFVFVLFKKIGDKTKKIIPCIILGIVTISATVYFFLESTHSNIMVVYYNTFTRVFSLLFGVLLGFISGYYKNLVPKIFKGKIIRNIIFSIYLVLLVLATIFIGADSKYFAISMILTTIITCRLIDYSSISEDKEMNLLDRFIKYIGSISYEIYLVQYPVIYLFQEVDMKDYLKIPIMIIWIVIISIIIHFCMNFKAKKVKVFRRIVFILISLFAIYGCYCYVIAEDHTKEMKDLEKLLDQNEKVMQGKKEEYLQQLKKEEDEWAKVLEDLEAGEEKVSEMVSNLSVVGVGDSVMLGAVNNLYGAFKNGYFDAAISRTAYSANDILNGLINMGMLGDPIVFNFGANGDCSDYHKDIIMQTVGNRKLFWLTVTNDKDVHFNQSIKDYASKYPNLYVIDWESISSGHPEYFYADGIHLTEPGREAYTKAIYDAIYNVYLDEFNAKKEEILSKHENLLKTKIDFYGNDILINSFNYISEEFGGNNFNTDKNYTYDKLIGDITKQVEDGTLSHNVLFAFDNSMALTQKEYEELVKLCEGHNIYIVVSNNLNLNLGENVKIIDFYKEIKSHTNYLMVDGIHLTEEGNIALGQILIENLK